MEKPNPALVVSVAAIIILMGMAIPSAFGLWDREIPPSWGHQSGLRSGLRPPLRPSFCPHSGGISRSHGLRPMGFLQSFRCWSNSHDLVIYTTDGNGNPTGLWLVGSPNPPSVVTRAYVPAFGLHSSPRDHSGRILRSHNSDIWNQKIKRSKWPK